MSGKALLIGAALDGLAGVENDVEQMARALTARGMSIERCIGNEASRAGILEAYQRLIASVTPGEAAVVYYSGHGGRVQPPRTGSPGPDLMDLQFIAPMDLHEAGPGEFRGITSVELSVLLARLTQRTDNATAIFDCCHSALISRQGGLRVKAIAEPTPYEILRAHIERLREAGSLQTSLLRATGNPHAVRIVACAQDQAAYEYDGDDGRRIGMLTESLVLALTSAGAERVSWATVLDQVRRRVQILAPSQRPEVEGPSRRLLFETEEDDLLASLRATDLGGGRLRLECAALLGVQPGETFAVLRPGGAAADPAARLGELTVDRVDAFAAEGPVALAPEITAVPIGARAHRLSSVAPVFPVRLPGDFPDNFPDGFPGAADAAALATAVAATPLLSVAQPGELQLAEVQCGPDGELTVADRIGPLHAPLPAGTSAVAQVIRDLNALARATRLRALSGDARWALNAAVTVEWGLVRNGERHPLPCAGAAVHVGTPIYISVRNDSANPIYVSLIDVGVSTRVTGLTNFAPAGVQLAPGKEYAYGFDDFAGVLAGLAPSWPDGLDPQHARPETVLIFVTGGPQDLSALWQEGVTRRRGPVSPLTALLDQTSAGGVRDLGAADAAQNRYDIHSFEFELDPVPDEGTFLIDERPGPAARSLVARGTGASKVAVRLEELIVHRNRAVFGTDIRLDAIVLTGGTTGAYPAYRTRTERFSGIRDGERLPLDRMLLYHGPAQDYLDIALWVSRDRSDSPDLAALLTRELADAEIQQALAKLGDAAASVPHAATAAAVIGVGAIVVNLAYRLLRASVGDVIGLYRGSRLAHEHFGAGRRPASGVRRVQDFSLAYTVDELA